MSATRRTAVRAFIRLLGPALLVLVILRIKDRGAVLHALTQAAGAYAKLLEVGEIEARLAEIEAALAGRSPVLTPSRPFTSAQA